MEKEKFAKENTEGAREWQPWEEADHLTVCSRGSENGTEIGTKFFIFGKMERQQIVETITSN